MIMIKCRNILIRCYALAWWINWLWLFAEELINNVSLIQGQILYRHIGQYFAYLCLFNDFRSRSWSNCLYLIMIKYLISVRVISLFTVWILDVHVLRILESVIHLPFIHCLTNSVQSYQWRVGLPIRLASGSTSGCKIWTLNDVLMMMI